MPHQSPSSLIRSADAIFIGAGPVGLYTAIQAKLYQPNLKIVMLERHETYIRHHILRIDKDSFKDPHPDSAFQELIKPLHGMVPTSIIENTLLNYAKSLGIKIMHRKVTSVEKLSTQAKNAKFIVGSDGARSLVRREIFQDKKNIDTNLQYIVEVKYKAQGSVTYLNTFDNISTLSQCEHFISENVGKEKDGETPVSLFFFSDKHTHDEIKALNTSAEKNLGLLDIPTNASKNLHRLSNSIRSWLAARKCSAHEIFITGSEKIASVSLPIYHSKHFICQQNAKNYLLVGDAAMGVPYFRALNAGLIGANHAAKLIGKQPLPPVATLPLIDKLDPIELPLMGRPLIYQQLLSNIAKQEIAAALLTNLKVQTGKTLAYVGQTFFPTTSASLANENLLDEIRQARLEQPNIFMRHHRCTLALIAWAAVSAALAIFTSISFTYLLPISFSILAAIIVTKACLWIFFNEQTAARPDFAWEHLPPPSDIENQTNQSNSPNFFQNEQDEYSNWFEIFSGYNDLEGSTFKASTQLPLR